jgi:transcriptional regulator with XRE-family HTH domain
MPGSTPTLLRDMVKDALASGRTYRQLAERAVDPETKQTASFALLNDIARGNVNRAPSVAHLRAIAVALDQPFEKVRQAAIDEYLPEKIDTRALLEQADQLEAEAERLKAIAERQMGGGESAGERDTA